MISDLKSHVLPFIGASWCALNGEKYYACKIAENALSNQYKQKVTDVMRYKVYKVNGGKHTVTSICYYKRGDEYHRVCLFVMGEHTPDEMLLEWEVYWI